MPEFRLTIGATRCLNLNQANFVASRNITITGSESEKDLIRLTDTVATIAIKLNTIIAKGERLKVELRDSRSGSSIPNSVYWVYKNGLAMRHHELGTDMFNTVGAAVRSMLMDVIDSINRGNIAP